MIRHPRFHRRGNADRGVNANEIIPSHVQDNGGFVVLQLFAVSLGKAGETVQVHPKAEIPALDVAGRDVARIGHSVDFGWDLFENGAGAIPIGANVGRALEDFDELGIVGAHPK